MISVLLPVYNAARTLPAALDSVRAQTATDWELICVDDGSTDATPHLLTAAADVDPRIIHLRRPHRGLVASLNDGLRACRRPWLARFDADDLMHPERLAQQLAAGFDGVLGCGVRLFPRADLSPATLAYETWLNELQTHQQIVTNLFVESPLVHPTVFLPRALLDRVGGWRDVGWAEDYDLWLRLWQAGARFAKLPAVLHEWRDEPGRLSRGGGVYSTRRFRWCKAAFLRETLLAGGAPVHIWGVGRVGRLWSRVLEGVGLRVADHLDPDDAQVGGLCRGRPIRPHAAAADLGGEPLIVTIGVLGARDRTRAYLDGLGLREGWDYICVA